MISLLSANLFEVLGLEWQKLLLYVGNFIILGVGLCCLIYKPVKKFMNKRQEEIKNQCELADNAKKEADAEIAKMQEELDKKQEELEVKTNEVRETLDKTNEERDRIIAEARERANKIIADANAEIKVEKDEARKQAQKELVDAAIQLAGNILQREIKEDENSKIIDSAIKDWEKND